jgi:hypothetical protein
MRFAQRGVLDKKIPRLVGGATARALSTARLGFVHSRIAGANADPASPQAVRVPVMHVGGLWPASVVSGLRVRGIASGVGAG